MYAASIHLATWITVGIAALALQGKEIVIMTVNARAD
jgi:hypothetical protein